MKLSLSSPTFFWFSACAFGVAWASFALPASAAELPQIYVQKVLVASGEFSPGDTVSGTVYLANMGAEDASGISYAARVVGDYDSSGFPLTTYASKTFGPVYLPAGAGRQVDFNVVIPASVREGDVGIEVQALLESGLPLGWSEARITVANPDAAELSVVGAYLSTGAGDTTQGDDGLYELEAGPTVNSGGHARLLIALLNEGKAQIAFTPTSIVYDRTIETGEELARTPYEEVTLAPGKTVTLSLPLPVFDYQPGVYAGALSFMTRAGAEALAPLSFRYIIGGDIAAIHAVSADKESVAQGEEVLLTVLFSGPPYVIGTASARQSAAALLSVSLFDERDQQVASASADIDLAQDGNVTVPLTAERTAQALRADVSIVKEDGTVLAALSVPLSSLYEALHIPDRALVSTTVLIVISILVILALIIAYFVFLRRNTPPSIPTPPGMAGSALALALVAAAAAFAPAAAQAFTITDGCWLCINGFGPPELFINTPAGTLQPGEKFYVTGTMRSIQCTNRPQSIYLSSSFGGSERNQTRGGGTYIDPSAWGAEICIYDFGFGGFCFPNPNYSPSAPDPLAKEIAENNYAGTTGVAYDVPWNGKWSHITDRFSMGPFYAPTTPGNYQVNVGGYWEEFFKDAHGRGGVYGYQPFTVAAPDVQCGANQHNDNGACVCDAGYTPQGGACIVTPPIPPGTPPGQPGAGGDDDDGEGDASCQLNAHRDSSNACVCDAGFALQGNACVMPSQCSDGIDNDGNGSADFAGAAGLPPDTGCSSLNDNDESVPDAELTLTPDKKIVKPGTAVVLTWGGAHIKNGSCALRGDNDESWNLPAGEGGGVGGSQLTGKLTAETRFTLTCVSLKTNSAISASTVVKVVPSFKEF